MGFMDKAKKLAEQAQAKTDELQKQFNEKQRQGAAPTPEGEVVQYDQHGRPIPSEHSAPPPPPAPPAPPSGGGGIPVPMPAPPAPAPASGPPTPMPTPPSGAPDETKDETKDEGYQPPPMSSGDPLAG